MLTNCKVPYKYEDVIAGILDALEYFRIGATILRTEFLKSRVDGHTLCPAPGNVSIWGTCVLGNEFIVFISISEVF